MYSGKLQCTHHILHLIFQQVFRALKHIADGHISFTQEQTRHGVVWSASVEKGSPFEFNETIWEDTTRNFLDPIKTLSDENFVLIVDDTKMYIKNGTIAVPPTDSIEVDSDHEDLFDFH